MTRTILASVLALSFAACSLETTETGDRTSAVAGRPYFDLFEGADGDWYFNLKAANHQVVLSSAGGYGTRTSALNAVLSVLDNGEQATRFDVQPAANGEYYFNLKARNGRVIGTSETYVTLSNARRGVDGVMRNVGEYLDYLAGRTGERFQVFQGADDRFYFSLYAGNGEIVLQSQGYSDEATAWNATFSVASNGVDEANYEINEASNGGFYFNLVATNGRVIGTSEVYSTRSNAQRGCDGVIALLPQVELL
ncbi:MAG: DUF1508 domain-containing protein [Myxococcota bacterium]